VGFDWKETSHIFDKLHEEVTELKEAIETRDAGEISEELGDLLFVVVNLARRLDVEPETALKKTNRKFRSRFKFIEDELKQMGRSLEETSLEEMDSLWDQAKAKSA
jgi:ATP diphosphatase